MLELRALRLVVRCDKYPNVFVDKSVCMGRELSPLLRVGNLDSGWPHSLTALPHYPTS